MIFQKYGSSSDISFTNDIFHKAEIISSTHTYHKNGYIRIHLPPHEPNDLLLLILSRTDDALPITLLEPSWKLVTSCLKPHNTKKQCIQIENGDCDNQTHGGLFCIGGMDLGTIIFYKIAG